MKNYLIQSAKYLVYLVALFLIIYFVMSLTKTTTVSIDELGRIFSSRAGWPFIGFSIVVSLLYPRFGFVTRDVNASKLQDRELVFRLLTAEGFSVVSEKDETITLKATSLFKKIMLRFDDTITIKTGTTLSSIKGPRKSVTRFLFRLDSHLMNR